MQDGPFLASRLFAALLITLIHTFMVRSDRTAFFLSLASFLCLAVTQGIFWMFTYPMNLASTNWTVTPADFESARRQWEYSHAVNAVLTFVALVTITASVVARKRDLAMMRATRVTAGATGNLPSMSEVHRSKSGHSMSALGLGRVKTFSWLRGGN
jgi:membrane-anchored protein YejM (alkaline phosphatase superfamily)